jgi:hypothetical protein
VESILAIFGKFSIGDKGFDSFVFPGSKGEYREATISHCIESWPLLHLQQIGKISPIGCGVPRLRLGSKSSDRVAFTGIAVPLRTDFESKIYSAKEAILGP